MMLLFKKVVEEKEKDEERTWSIYALTLESFMFRKVLESQRKSGRWREMTHQALSERHLGHIISMQSPSIVDID